jgi:hypothetical protein
MKSTLAQHRRTRTSALACNGDRRDRGHLFAPTRYNFRKRIKMRGLFHACFFGLLILVVSWYGRYETRDLLLRSVDRTYRATRMDRVVGFAHDYMIVPVRQVLGMGEDATSEGVRGGTEAAYVVSRQGVRETAASMSGAVTSWAVRAFERVFGHEEPRTEKQQIGTSGTHRAGASRRPDDSPASKR